MEKGMSITLQCTVCGRFHDTDRPCPMRIAKAQLMKPKALDELTEADKEWIKAQEDPDILGILEDVLADMM